MARRTVAKTDIVGVALQYRGHPYVYGVWDCSGFVNHVLGQRLGFVLPGGIRRYKGPPPHGPVVWDYWTWQGATTITGPPRPGDLCIWPGEGPNGHIGFAVSGTHMISALDPQYGTLVTPIANNGPPGVTVRFRSIHGAGDYVPAGVGKGLRGQLAATGNAMLIRLMLITGLSAGALLAVAVGLVALQSAGPLALGAVLTGRRARSDLD